ncbi:hypothetical protein [Candidatus Enterovibrio altilux]|nr:hypothetical protein [Candidatus Enterovibrio luxaltus]
MLLNLLKQTRLKINVILGDGADDTRSVTKPFVLNELFHSSN